MEVKLPEKKRKVWDNYRVVGAVRKSDKIKLVVGVGCRDGVRMINIREFYNYRDRGWRPGRDGIVFPLKVPVDKGTKIITPFTDLLSVLAEAVDVLNNLPLEDEANAVYAISVPKEKKNGKD